MANGGGHGMPLRNGTVVGQVVLPREHWPRFEQGVTLVFRNWMALRLAVENEWGGRSSVRKADELIDDVLHWFTTKREHYADELECELDDTLQAEFNTQCEDGSPAEVARTLVEMYKQCLTGDFSSIERLKASVAPPTSACAAEAGAAGLPSGAGSGAASSSTSGSGSDDDGSSGMEVDGMDVDGDEAPPTPVPLGKPPPVVDGDGFQLVTGRRRR